MIGVRTRKMIGAREPQLDLAIELPPKRCGRGGARTGAGRKKLPGRRDSPHRTRPAHKKWQPVHVVMRTLKTVPRLRRRKVFDAVRRAFRAISDKASFRVVHLSIQHNHLHFLVEADSRDALVHGMQSLNISIARQINRVCGRRGKVFAHRFHATPITSPRQARNALAYVLNNWRHHREDRVNGRLCTAALDEFSSAISFAGWREETRFAIPEDYTPLPVASPRTWLLASGWKRHPAISWREVPSGSSRARP